MAGTVTTLRLAELPFDHHRSGPFGGEGGPGARAWLDSHGFSGAYDFFLWFPAKAKRSRQAVTQGAVRQRGGYCFVNFRSASVAAELASLSSAEGEGIEVSVCHVQGFSANYARYRHLLESPRCDSFCACDALENLPAQEGPAETVTLPPCAHVYLKVYKPRGVICSHRRERLSERPIVSSLYPDNTPGLRPVGRLDADSEGLLLLTTHGDFANAATAPEVHLEKEYLALVYCGRTRAAPSLEALASLTAGLELRDGLARAEAAEVLGFDGLYARLRIVVTSGRNRMVRRMLQAVGYSCQQLLRTRIGAIGGIAVPSLAAAAAEAAAPAAWSAAAATEAQGGLRPGEYAALRPEEVAAILGLSRPSGPQK